MTKTGDAARPILDEGPETITEFVQQYQRPLTIAAIVVALGAGGWWMARRSAEIRETRAAQALQVGETAYVSGNLPLAQTEFEKVVTRYPGTTAGAQAALVSAQIYFEEGKFDEGIARLEAAARKAPDHTLPGVLAVQAAGKGMAGKHAEAAADYERAAREAQFRQEREQYQMDAARQWVLASNYVAARALFQSIADKEDSGHAGEARLRLGEIQGKS
jgi:predicted negative regulator of RcsB-dependent stress response